MKLTLTNLVVALSMAASTALAQQPADTAVDIEDVDAYEPLENYSQSASLAKAPSLDLIAINKPAAFEGLAIVDADGEELGRVAAITRGKQDNALHAVITTAAGSQRVLRLDALALDALALWAPENALTNETYTEAEFEPVSQQQSGHTAWGSLRQPAEAPADQSPQPAPLPGPVVDPIEAQQQALADQAAQHSRGGQAETPAVANQQPTYETSNSPIVLLALNQSDALHGRVLLDESGQTLGQIDRIAKKISDQELYAVLMRVDATQLSAVKLEALTIGRLLFESSAADLQDQAYDADDFERVAE